MSSYHDSRGDRYAPPPRQRDVSSSSSSRPPPSGPSSRQYSGPPSASSSSPTGPPRHPSSSYSRAYDSAPRGPRHDSTPVHSRYEPPQPPRRPHLSLWGTQNPGRDGYHHSGQPLSQPRPYSSSTYRDQERDSGYDRDYRPSRDQRYRDSAPVQRDSYLPPSGPRDSYRDQNRHASSSYYPNYSASPSPPTGPRHAYPSYQPPPSSHRQTQEPRSRERTPSGPAAWSNRQSTTDRRYYEGSRPHDHSPAQSVQSRPHSPPHSARRDDFPKTSPREPLERRKSEVQDIKLNIQKASLDILPVKQEDSRPPTPKKVEDEEVKPILEEKQPEEGEGGDEETLTQEDVERRIQTIDEEIAAVTHRIARIDEEKTERAQQIQILQETINIPPSPSPPPPQPSFLPPPPPQVVKVKAEVPEEDETEEDTEMIETPIEEERFPPAKEIRLPKSRKRSRPTSEFGGDQENVRVRIWRYLKETSIKDEEEPEKFSLTSVTTDALKIIEKVEDLSDHEEAEQLHRNSRRAIFRTLYVRRKRQQHFQEKLRRKYHQQYNAWQADMDKLDSQRQQEMERLGMNLPKSAETPVTPRTEGVPLTGTTNPETATPADGLTRGTRRAQQAAHARDYVQSEAEFLELMQSLGTEEKEPAAEIPPMLPPDERDMIYFDDSGLIHDPVKFFSDALCTVEEGTKINFNGWSEEENKTFLRRLAFVGKQFGRFRRAAPLQNRSVQELVQHYYFLKGDGEGLDWRNVIAGKNRYGKNSGIGRSNAPGALIGSGAPGGKPRSAGRGRGRGRGAVAIALLHSKRDDDEDDTRSAADDDGDDSGSITTERVRTARGKKGRVVESTAAKQRPKRSIGSNLPREKMNQPIAPSPVPSSFEEGPPSRERSLLPPAFTFPLYNQAEVATSMDRDSSVPPTEKKRGKHPQTSSYWRVNEMEMFPKYLQIYGKNWRKIAEEMGTKTAQQVKNYFTKNADTLGLNKIADEAESGLSRVMSVSIAPKVDLSTEIPAPQNPLPVPSVLQPLFEPVLEPSQQLKQPQPPAPPKTLPTVASLLNSPVQEMTRPERSWPEPLAPTPLPPAPSAMSLTLPEAEQRIRSPSNLSETSRSQSQGDYYSRDMGRQPAIYSQQSIQSGSIRDDSYYREDSSSQSIPPPNRYTGQSNLLPPVHVHDSLSSQSHYYQNPPSSYDSRMPPPEPSFSREPYSRSPAEQRSHHLSSFPPHSIPTSDNRSVYYRDQERRDPLRDSRYSQFRDDPYYERPDRELYRYEDERYTRDRYERDMRHLESLEYERMERQRADRERERDPWRERYSPEYPRAYPRPRSPDRMMFNRDYGRDEWERLERDRIERDRIERLDRDRFEREKWTRR